MDADRVVATRAGKSHRLLGGNRWIQQRTGLRARREAAVRQHEAVGKAFPMSGYARAGGRRDDLESRLTHQADAKGLRDPGQAICRRRVPLAAVVHRTVRLDVRDRRDGRQRGDLVRDERLDLLRGQRSLDSPEPRAVVVAGMRTNLDSQRLTAARRRDRE